jgi:PHD/YefM family antitoxin component YafN of YafNO toxin-antitoxin module
MNARIMSSDDIRRDWHEVVGNVTSGGTVVVQDANQDVAAIIPIEYFLALREQIEELEDIRNAENALEEYRRDPSTAISLEEAEAILRADGLLDEE